MQPNTRIKEATQADVPIIKNLAEATWTHTYGSILSQEQIDYMYRVIYTSDALLQQMQEGQTFLILFEGDQPVGFASYSEKSAADQVYKLNKIYLLPECQGKGYGKLLLTAVEEEVIQLGGTVLDLNVNRYNKAKEFYERCGYNIHQQEDIAIGPYWMNDYVMRKML
ncbi:GNAT superfamily N-acetyltransferase [Pontibacter aydingkolensis]|uniref:GNAT family N-acetyltransferase n=1 Tax=Pontibacter aydingkolensis TaxID=1911536 RepID=A0ABS7CYE0_9BACT|nr:GNAT family N-acetyltransferase [Pontibacter aydingkolensis]MBW7468863.1 GNAT family N-acetyltransferase [Pontibacter aydingkolensis]